MKKIICVVGMHRSGTSMVTHLIREMGVYIGQDAELEEGSLYNRDGHFELMSVVEIHDKILKYYSRSWYDTIPFQLDLNDAFVVECKSELKSIILDQLRTVDYFGLKDPRMCLMLPLWIQIFQELNVEVQYIVIYRNPVEVAYSLKKRDGIPVKYGEELWYYYNSTALKNIQGNVFFVRYDQLLKERCWTEKLYEYIFGVAYHKKDIRKVIKQEYKHEKYQSGRDIACVHAYKLYLYMDKYLQGFTDEYQNRCRELDIGYIKEWQECKEWNPVERVDLTKLPNEKIVIYGAGKCGRKVLKYLCDEKIEPVAFGDVNADRLERSIQGYPVIGLNKLREIAGKIDLLLIISIENKVIAYNAYRMLKEIESMKFVFYEQIMTEKD